MGAANSAHGIVESSRKLAAVEGSSVGQIRVVFAPDVFRRVEFGSISGKPFDMNAMTSSKEVPHFHALVDGSAIPKEEERSAKMLEKMPQKRDDVQSIEVMCTHSDIESQPLPPGRKDQSVEDRNPVLLVEIVDLGSLSPECPGPLDVRDEQEPTFVEKDQLGLEPFGFFLYAAKCNASNVRWLPRPFVMLAAPVSGNLTPGWSGVSKHGNGDTRPRNICESDAPHGLVSTDPWRNLEPESQPEEVPKVSPSEAGRACADAPAPVGNAIPSDPSLGSSATSETLSLRPHLRFELPPTVFCRLLKAGWRAGVASPGTLGFHMVSCII